MRYSLEIELPPELQVKYDQGMALACVYGQVKDATDPKLLDKLLQAKAAAWNIDIENIRVRYQNIARELEHEIPFVGPDVCLYNSQSDESATEY